MYVCLNQFSAINANLTNIKGRFQQDFLLKFFRQTTPPGLIRHAFKGFRILSNIREIIRIINLKKILILPLSSATGSRFNAKHLT
jgi:hypothetical protein